MKNLEFRIVRRRHYFLILNSKFLILCGLSVLCGKAFCSELKLKFAPGDKYSLVSVTEQKASRVIDGNEWSAEQTTRLECDLDVQEVDENSVAWTKYTYKRVIMTLRSKDQKLDFDSDANESKVPTPAIPFKLAIGEEIYLRITPQGRIEKINGLQALITSAKAKMGDFPGADAVSRDIDRQFDEPAVRHTLEDQFEVFPDSNSEGAAWTRKKVLSSANVVYATAKQIEEVNIVFEKTFRLNSPAAVVRQQDAGGQGGISVVDVNLIIQPASLNPGRASRGGPQVADTQAPDQYVATSTGTSREISGDGAGQIEIENATGRIISNKMTQDTIERLKYATPSHLRRPTPSPEPIITHTVTTFRMTKIDSAKSAQPADANEKTEKGG
jgi:Family of unknown function (DUF6263)